MAKESKAPKQTEQSVSIKAPNILTTAFRVQGTAPFVMNKFSEKARNQIKATQEAGSQARGKKQREPKDFDQVLEGAKHYSAEGWIGIPAPAFRAAMISACRLVGFQMTKAKLSVFVVAEGLDVDDGTPLVPIYGECEAHEGYVRNETGVIDLRNRPMWREWYADVTIRWDGDQFTADDIMNLLNRAGMQVGIGEGRPDSKKSAGCGWGTFQVAEINPIPGVPPEGFGRAQAAE